MISGDLIRLKNLVDDCERVVRSIRREWEHLTLDERNYLVQHVQNTFPALKEIFTDKPPAGPPKQG